MKNKVTIKVPCYDDPPTESLLVCSHWNTNDFVVLSIGDKQVTVVARQLKSAIDSATMDNT